MFDTFTSFRDIVNGQENNFSMSASGCYNDMDMSVNFTDIGIPYESSMGLELHNVLTGEELGIVRDYYMEKVKSHSCLVFKGKLVNI